VAPEKKDDDMPDFSDVQSGASTTAQGAEVEVESYEVKPGDSLSKIAKRVYGDAGDWKRIFEANRDLIKDPDKIFPGQKLKIPSAS
jgi:nucleoid-associated protein YgaU